MTFDGDTQHRVLLYRVNGLLTAQASVNIDDEGMTPSPMAIFASLTGGSSVEKIDLVMYGYPHIIVKCRL